MSETIKNLLIISPDTETRLGLVERFQTRCPEWLVTHRKELAGPNRQTQITLAPNLVLFAPEPQDHTSIEHMVDDLEFVRLSQPNLPGFFVIPDEEETTTLVSTLLRPLPNTRFVTRDDYGRRFDNFLRLMKALMRQRP